MFTKLLTVSAFTLALATGAMAQTSDSDTSNNSSGSTGQTTDNSATGSTGAGENPSGGTVDDDHCTETSAERTTAAGDKGTMPETACPTD